MLGYLDEALQRSAGVADAPLPVLAAGAPRHALKLGGREPLVVVFDAATFAPWTQTHMLVQTDARRGHEGSGGVMRGQEGPGGVRGGQEGSGGARRGQTHPHPLSSI